MSPSTVFIIRLLLAVGSAVFLNVMFFGRLNWINVVLLAGFMLGVAYAVEALRTRKG